MIKKAKWFSKELLIRASYMKSSDCIFCKVINGEIKTEYIEQGKYSAAFYDLNPVCQVHILIVPKKHIKSVLTIENADSKTIIEMFGLASKIVNDMQIKAFKLTYNGGSLQHIGHLHMHLLAGKDLK